LRSTIDWSYDLLEAPECHALDRLSVVEHVVDGDTRSL
jgi:predicted ATPase